MPIEKELHYLPRWWVCNIAFTVIGPPFKDWVDKMIKKRNEDI
jgi:hypothetical protein